MMSYFPSEHSSYSLYQGDIAKTLELITNRYIAAHPAQPWVFRASNRGAFQRGVDYRYHFDLERKFPHMREGQFVYAWAKLWCEQEAELSFSVSCFAPVRLYVNGELTFRSNIMEDVFPEHRSSFRCKLAQGWNHFVLLFEKTGTGCGGWFGTGSIKGFPLHFITPSIDRDGQEGWLYTEPLDERLPELPGLLGEGMREADTGLNWLPRNAWNSQELAAGVFGRLFGAAAPEGALLQAAAGGEGLSQQQPSQVQARQRQALQRIAFGWTQLRSRKPGTIQVPITGHFNGSLIIYLDGRIVYESCKEAGSFHLILEVTYGEHDFVVQSTCPTESENHREWDVQFDPITAVDMAAPVQVLGTREKWLYIGPFAPEQAPDIERLCRTDHVFATIDGGSYWRLDEPQTVLRPFVETSHFARWNYPLGVTLYGILRTGLELKRQDYVAYALAHIEQCTAYEQYALWDKEQYGGAGINHQLTAIDSLDDCGSFAATMLFALQQRELRGAREVAARIAKYISCEQSRREDGALYRAEGSTVFMQATMWCDDLYMSTPFLARYYELTGDEQYVNDAAEQFILYKSYLYMPEHKIMSHVYDFKFAKPTNIPWGRGNGWVLFSLTELLRVLPEEHARRLELLQFFRDLSAGYLRLQGKDGLWHQVLTMQDSYAESSCTSMFIYAFARGVRYGWYAHDASAEYVEAVEKGWEGLTRIAIDRHGDVYGVCRGSGYAFSPLYYKDDLPWKLNDTHGIGIILLAGIETMLLRSFLSERGGEISGSRPEESA